MAVAGGKWPWTRLGFEHASFSAEIHGQDNRKLSVLAKSVLGGRSPIVPDSPIGMGGGSSSVVPPVSRARKTGRGMRPAGGNRRSPQKVNVVPRDVIGRMVVVSDGPVVKENARVVPLSVEAEEFSLRAVPSRWVPIGEGPDSRGNCVPPREMLRGVFGRTDAVISTTAVTGAASPTDFAGAVAPADLAGTDVPAVAGKKFSAVAEVHSLVIRASKQQHAVVEVGPVRPGEECCSPVDFVTVPEPIEHSVDGVPNEVGSSSVDSVAVPVPIEQLGVRGTADTPSTDQPMQHSETSGDGENGRHNHAGEGNSPLDV